MLIVPQLGFFNGNTKPVIVALGEQGLYTSPNGESYTRQSTVITGYLNEGYALQDAVAFGGIAYVPSRDGRIYTTTDFRTFTQVSISSIQANGGASNPLRFENGASLFKLSAYPTRIFAVAYSPPSPSQLNDACSIWYSTDGCVTWLLFTSNFTGINASSQCKKIIDGGDGNLYASLELAGGSINKLARIRISDGVRTGITDAGVSGSDIIKIEGSSNIWFAQNAQYMSTSSFGDPLATGAANVSGFTGANVASGIIGGNRRYVCIGRNSGTGRLQITYTFNPQSTAWTAATTPNITISGLYPGYTQIASLGTDKGFVAVYADTGDGNNSGALYSVDGITWTQASTENPAFVRVTKVYVNPLI